ncbi:AraC family transcriptional regulator [Motiliproteus coralliicola]|uniref:AraC family transcriptional regulator n=1 Tax=Motiliproteus coralliicola TaxID=2283196 RepID=UPI0014038812|nr:AraC family transcriptional regulator [Motiliproteus coralliicola]
MPPSTKQIDQHYQHFTALPQLGLRSTSGSTQGYKAHSHPQLSIGAVIDGQTCLTIDGGQHLIGTGELVIIEPERVHACNPIDGQSRSYHMLYVDNHWCLERLSRLYQKPTRRFNCDQRRIDNPELFKRYLALIDQLQQQRYKQAETTLEALALELLSRWCSPAEIDDSADGLEQRLRRRLLDDIAQPPSLDLLAVEFGRSKESLIRRFGQAFGITPKAFITNARIEQAKLLLQNNAPLVEVAMAVGFSDQSQFHRAFVNYTASTPRQYQQSRSIFDNND